ncbi:MAG: carbamoyltransferase HypF, partial [Spirochaetaceae bacterium]
METKRVIVRGVVQGVGFRPFVYLKARENGLAGMVKNNPQGVEILVQGRHEGIVSLVNAIRNYPPPRAVVEEVSVSQFDTDKIWDSFSITESDQTGTRNARIASDSAICENCLEELFQKDNRRYYYPYINCTHCGPRFTIIKDIPYDRASTTMAGWTMCGPCADEYHDPSNRRFHAQPNACFECGPHMHLSERNGNLIVSGKTSIRMQELIIQTANILREGKIVAIKGLGGFHLAVNALDDQAVIRLRERKNREKKPFALMVGDLNALQNIAVAGVQEQNRLACAERPIILLEKRENSPVADVVAPDNNNLGVMLPYTPLQFLLFETINFPLVMTSGNINDEPIAFTDKNALDRLADIADFFILGDREIHTRIDDSVMRLWNGADYPIRRARGFVPAPINLKKKQPANILALGPELKNTICLSHDGVAYMSHHIGDLKNRETADSLYHAISHFTKIYGIKPDIIAHDMHPLYESTQAAFDPPPSLSWMNRLPKIAVQHHHAHIVSCMAEHGLEESVLGVALDGTGYGTDNTIWGGEILVAKHAGFSRGASLKKVKMPGADAAVRFPKRMSLSYLWEIFGENVREHIPAAMSDMVTPEEVDMTLYQIFAGMNSPMTSSAGRLFDAVSAFSGICGESKFEAQAAIMLEHAAEKDEKGSYHFDLCQGREQG